MGKPLPIRSIAALRKGVCAGSFGVFDPSTKYANALPVNENTQF